MKQPKLIRKFIKMKRVAYNLSTKRENHREESKGINKNPVNVIYDYDVYTLIQYSCSV